MTVFESAILGLIQGLTELLPVSSSGHLVLAHAYIGALVGDLTFDALLHFATAAAIVVYFRADIYALLKAAFLVTGKLSKQVFSFQFSVFSLSEREREALALVAGTVPAVILGLLLEHLMETLFRNPLLVAATAVVGALIMAGAEYYRAHCIECSQEGAFAMMTVQKGFLIGLFQSLALVPGMSRSGMSIAGGMFLGLSRAAAARFGFLLGVPLLLGAGAKKIVDIEEGGAMSLLSPDILMGTAVAFVSALVVIHFLLRFLRNHSLYWFVVYRFLLAAVIVAVVLG